MGSFIGKQENSGIQPEARLAKFGDNSSFKNVADRMASDLSINFCARYGECLVSLFLRLNYDD